ncbi:MAG: hypothetical protein WBY69_05650 [Candidatus Acidiferrales bacterium]
MREVILRDFFLGRITPPELAADVRGSVKKVGAISFVAEIEDMDDEFSVTRQMLVSLCEAVLSDQLPSQDLSTIGFALLASEKFVWDAEDLVGDVIHDWSCPEINYPLTLENVQRFKDWLLEKELYPSKVQPQTRTSFNPKRERLISRVQKKPLRKRVH